MKPAIMEPHSYKFVELALTLLLVLLTGFFVAAEFALVKVRSTRLSELAQAGNQNAARAVRALAHINDYLSATQLGITVCTLVLGNIGETAVESLLHPMFGRVPASIRHTFTSGVALTLVMMLEVIIGEMAPKTLAIKQAEKVTLALILPLTIFTKIFRPLIILMNAIAGLVLRPFGIKQTDDHGHGDSLSADELRLMLTASRNSGTIQESEWNLATRVLDFSHSQAKDVMIPRPDVTFVDSAHTLPDIVRQVSASGHTRFPVIRNGNPDDVIGIIHVKEIVKLTGDDITPALRTVLRVPETKSTEALLRTMQRMRTHMSVVVDEYGGTAGIVTIEDIVEEIVGDIQDEFETDLPELVRDNQAVIVDARMTLVKLTRHFEITMPENDEDIETVGGWILANASQAIIKPGTTVPFGGYTFTVIEVTGRRVRRVRVSTTLSGDAESNGTSADAS